MQGYGWMQGQLQVHCSLDASCRIRCREISTVVLLSIFAFTSRPFSTLLLSGSKLLFPAREGTRNVPAS
jgi:hypothetical protein